MKSESIYREMLRLGEVRYHRAEQLIDQLTVLLAVEKRAKVPNGQAVHIVELRLGAAREELRHAHNFITETKHREQALTLLQPDPNELRTVVYELIGLLGCRFADGTLDNDDTPLVECMRRARMAIGTAHRETNHVKPNKPNRRKKKQADTLEVIDAIGRAL